MSEESRLGRERVETEWNLKQIVDAGVRAFYYLADREALLDDATNSMLEAFSLYASPMEREKARQRTHDPMVRKARAGFVTGNRVYAYTNIEVLGPDGRRAHVARQVNADEAAVIRRIFELCASGLGLTRIAKTLNAERVLPPRNQRTGWVPTAIREILHRPPPALPRRNRLGDEPEDGTRRRSGDARSPSGSGSTPRTCGSSPPTSRARPRSG